MALLQRLARKPLALDRLVELTLIVRKPRIDQMIVAHLYLHVEAERALGIGPRHAVDTAHEVISHMVRRAGGKGALTGKLVSL